MTASNASANPLVVLYGDSRAADWPDPPLPGITVVNRGMPGQSSSVARQRVEPYLDSLPAARVVIVQVGINDLTSIVHFPDQRQAILNRCRENIRDITAKIVKRGAIAILSTVFPVGYLQFDVWGYGLDNIIPDIIILNGVLQSWAGDQVVIFDAYDILVEERWVKPDYVLDPLHVNAAGYEALNQQLAPLLEKILINKKNGEPS